MQWVKVAAALATMWLYTTFEPAAFKAGVVIVHQQVRDRPLRSIGWTGELLPWPLTKVVGVSTAVQKIVIPSVRCSSKGVNFELPTVEMTAAVVDAPRFIRAVGTSAGALTNHLTAAINHYMTLCSAYEPSMLMMIDVAELSANATAALGSLSAIGVRVSRVQISETFQSASDFDEIHAASMAAGIRKLSAEATRKAIVAESYNEEIKARGRVKATMIEFNATMDRALRSAEVNATAAYLRANASIAGDLLAKQLLFSDDPRGFAAWKQASNLENSATTTYVLGAPNFV